MTDISTEPRLDPTDEYRGEIGVCAVCGEKVYEWETWYDLFNTIVCEECVMNAMHTGN